MPQLIADENGVSNFVDRANQSGFVDADGDFFATAEAPPAAYSYVSFTMSLLLATILTTLVL